MITKVIPSPDWFVGVSDLDLCSNNRWIETLLIDADPYDGGVEQGYTFTAPKFESDPQQIITKITSQHPNHPANGFYYPHLKKLARLGYFQFVKLREYRMIPESITNSFEGGKYNKNDMFSKGVPQKHPNTIISSLGTKIKSHGFTTSKKRERQEKQASDECLLSDWSEWSHCQNKDGERSASSCFSISGTKTRKRTIIKSSKRCSEQQLIQSSWCPLVRPIHCDSMKRTLSKYHHW